MEVVDRSWTEQARRRGRKIGVGTMGSGLTLVVVGLAFVGTGAVGPLWYGSALAALYGANLVLGGYRRWKVESAPVQRHPLVLTAVMDPGRFALLGNPLPGFGLKVMKFQPFKAVASSAVMFGVPVFIAASSGGLSALLVSAPIWAVIVAKNANWTLRGLPGQVRVSHGVIHWAATYRTEEIPVSSLRRVRCNTVPTTVTVLEFEGHPSRVLPVTGGFADFLEALTVTCPWVDVSEDVVQRSDRGPARRSASSSSRRRPTAGLRPHPAPDRATRAATRPDESVDRSGAGEGEGEGLGEGDVAGEVEA